MLSIVTQNNNRQFSNENRFKISVGLNGSYKALLSLQRLWDVENPLGRTRVSKSPREPGLNVVQYIR